MNNLGNGRSNMSYKYEINKYFKQLQEGLLNVKELFTHSDNSIHKARNELKTATIKDVGCVIKSFKVPNLLNQFIYAYIRDSKAKKSYHYALKIQDFTPKPVGYIEFYHSALLKESYFISEEFKYDFTIREPLLDKSFPHRDEIFKAFSRFTLELHQQNIFHKDYSPGNILIKKSEDGTYIFKIVDINRMSFFQLNQKERAKNFSKLWADEETLRTMAEEYAKHYPVSTSFTDEVIYYSQKNKNIKNFKKRLKGKPVVD